MYHEGQGVPQDYTEAMKWFRKAAEHGVAEAQFSLGALHLRGDGVPQDYAKAVKWWRKAWMLLAMMVDPLNVFQETWSMRGYLPACYLLCFQSR